MFCKKRFSEIKITGIFFGIVPYKNLRKQSDSLTQNII